MIKTNIRVKQHVLSVAARAVYIHLVQCHAVHVTGFVDHKNAFSNMPKKNRHGRADRYPQNARKDISVKYVKKLLDWDDRPPTVHQ